MMVLRYVWRRAGVVVHRRHRFDSLRTVRHRRVCHSRRRLQRRPGGGTEVVSHAHGAVRLKRQHQESECREGSDEAMECAHTRGVRDVQALASRHHVTEHGGRGERHGWKPSGVSDFS